MTWLSRAACTGLDPDLFFPERGESTREAKAVCAGCPVRADCLEDALVTVVKHGIRGGTSERERRKMRSVRGLVTPLPVEPCGSDAAWARHRRAGETPCVRCTEAHNAAVDERRERGAA